jgi:hypothetical protein
MLANLDAADARLVARPPVDPGLVQTGGEAAERPEGAPGEIDPSVLEKARRELGVKGVPVIFDLPPAVAARRADQFARAVHPVLQAACVRCHGEGYGGAFQLVPVKSRKDLTANTYRANLDAVLRLVDPDNPARSELLSSAVMPHGRGPNRRPIFRGSNDPRFQVVAAWVNSLRPGAGRPAEGPATPRDGAGVAFASERGQGPGVSVTPVDWNSPVKPYPVGGRTDVKPPVRYVPGKGFEVEKVPPQAGEFPLPFAVGGAVPKRDGVAPGSRASIPMPGQPAPGAAGGNLPTLPPAPDGIPPDDPTLTPSKPKAPVKLDPAALERALNQINSRRR